MLRPRPFLLAVAHVHGLAGAADSTGQMQLPRIECRLVNYAPVDRRHHAGARCDVDFHAGKSDQVDLLRLGLVHGAQLREDIRLLVLHRDAGLAGEWIEEGLGDRSFPGAAITEIGDGLLGLATADVCERGEERRGAGRSGRERPRQGAHKIAAIETACLRQHAAQSCADIIHICGAHRYRSVFFCRPLAERGPIGSGWNGPSRMSR